MLSRKQFIRSISVLGGAVLAPWQQWARSRSVSQIDQQPLPLGADLYGGFILLPQGTNVPSFVKDYQYGIPSLCGASDGTEDRPHSPIQAIYTPVQSAQDIRALAQLPLYALKVLPKGVRAAGGALTQYTNGNVFSGEIVYQSLDAVTGQWFTSVVISVQTDYPQPFPLWYSTAVEPDVPGITLEKVSFAPGGAGILVRPRNGVVLHWIDRKCYHFMTLDGSLDVKVEDLVSALTVAD